MKQSCSHRETILLTSTLSLRICAATLLCSRVYSTKAKPCSRRGILQALLLHGASSYHLVTYALRLCLVDLTCWRIRVHRRQFLAWPVTAARCILRYCATHSRSVLYDFACQGHRAKTLFCKSLIDNGPRRGVTECGVLHDCGLFMAKKPCVGRC